ncbi:hypothetical protein GALL_527180 [mine drainage metagenome]|uniref:Uncharacterized protein n=1 Tax=mine drainage metagenome TaxID=410659 RepID=A0A1J5PD21_9ZZZZ
MTATEEARSTASASSAAATTTTGACAHHSRLTRSASAAGDVSAATVVPVDAAVRATAPTDPRLPGSAATAPVESDPAAVDPVGLRSGIRACDPTPVHPAIRPRAAPMAIAATSRSRTGDPLSVDERCPPL